MDLAQRIEARGSEFLLFALTPPRLTVTREQAQKVADVTQKRLAPVGLDGLVLYDIDEESDRNPDERPFPSVEGTFSFMDNGTHRSVKSLNTDIRAWIQTRNDNPRPYVWIKTADEILASVAAYCQRIKDSEH